jgi:cytochrome c553
MWAYCSVTFAADPLRGRQLYNTAPQSGLLACVDCHGEQPQQQNFGNIWAGRHATFLIARAISINTGGMGYFRNFYDQQALADIAAWLGTTPASLNFAESATGSSSAAQGVTLTASTKAGITGLSWQPQGDYTVSPGNCGNTVERFSACTLEVAFAPKEPGQRPGALIISHDGSPTPIRIALSGTGQARPQAVASLSPALLEFSTASPMRTATLRNDSTNPLTVQQVRVSADGLRWAGGSCTAGVVLTEKATCSVLLAFEPSQTGTSAGQLTISHDGQAGASTIDLRGTAATRAPRLRSSIATLDLGVISPGETATSGWISFINDGPGPLSWAPPTIDGPAFSIAETDCDGYPDGRGIQLPGPPGVPAHTDRRVHVNAPMASLCGAHARGAALGLGQRWSRGAASLAILHGLRRNGRHLERGGGADARHGQPRNCACRAGATGGNRAQCGRLQPARDG